MQTHVPVFEEDVLIWPHFVAKGQGCGSTFTLVLAYLLPAWLILDPAFLSPQAASPRRIPWAR